MTLARPTPNAAPAQLDGDRIVATLHRLGVRYIVAEDGAEAYDDLPPEQLIAALVSGRSIRVEYAVIPLLMRHPEFASAVPELAASLPVARAELLKRHYTAAVYLQRMYRPALEIYLGKKPNLPDYFSTEMGLPSPEEYYGEIGLRELISRLPPPINWWLSYLDPVQMFIRTLSLEKTYGWTTD
jgi:hypothetical protein